MSRRARRSAIVAVTSISLLVGIDGELGDVLGTSGSREAAIENGHETLRKGAGSLVETDSDPFSRIRRALAAREYEASTGASGLQAPNRRHDLRTFFTEMGVEVHDRTAAGSPRLLSLSLAGVGRGDGPFAPVESGTTTSIGNRVEISRPGLVEWYENSDAGLEQGFTFAKRPEVASATGQRGGASAGEMLVLELAIDHARASLWGDRVLLATQTGRQLAYDKLVVTDADGVQIPSRIEVPEPDRIRLVVADAGARYPIVIDPILTETSDATLESGQTNVPLVMREAGDVDGDGYGDLIFGASRFDTGPSGIGAAFIVHGSADGITNQDMSMALTRLDPSGASGSNFGFDVASAGDVNGDGYDDVIVTAPTWTNGQSLEGGAFVFHGSPTGVPDGGIATAATMFELNQANLLGGNFAVRARGAGDVDGDGFDDVIVGFSEYSGTVNQEGGAFLFHGSPTGIPSGGPSTAATRLASGQTGSEFGWRVTSAGDVNGDGYDDVVVGAPGYAVPGVGIAGAAFVFLGGEDGVADATSATAATRIRSEAPNAYLGWDVADAGDVNGDGYADVIVGAPRYQAFGSPGLGAALVLYGGAGGIPDAFASESPTVLTGSVGGLLGWGVAGVGDVDGDGHADVMAGEPGAVVFDGAAHVYLGRAAAIPSGGPAVADVTFVGSGGESLGVGVAGAGDVDGDGFADVLAATLPNFDLLVNGAPVPPEANVVHLYRGGAGLPDASPTSATTRLESNQEGAAFGHSVAVGDVNGDGLGDVVVGARRYDGGQIGEGAVFVFHGTPNGIADADISLAPTRIESNQESAALGTSVAVGDVNGDGVEDVLVGAPSYDAGETNEGALFVFHGVRLAGLGSRGAQDADATFQSDQASAFLGDGVGFAGDVDGDGFGDVLVAARDYDAGQTNEGAVFVLHGSASGITATDPSNADSTIESDQGSSSFDAVAGAGDVDGDGFADIVVGASLYDAGESNEGAVFVFRGSVSGIASGGAAAVADTLIQGNQSSVAIGDQVASAGDVNGDGFSDVIVSSTTINGAVLGSGAAFVFHGGIGGIASGGVTTATSRLDGDQTNARFGSSVASAGDVDGDGHGDVVVGADGYDLDETNEGAVFVFLGGNAGVASGTPSTTHAVFTGGAPGSISTSVGRAIAAGDIDGDGRSDLVVGASFYDAAQLNEGGVFVVLGNGRSGRDLALRASPIADPVTTLQPWQLATGGFDVSLSATHPQGRGRTKLEVEWCPTGVAFGDPACGTRISSSWTDVGSTAEGSALSETIATASPPGLYRWRARVLHASLGVTQPGVVPSPNPRHGPWLRPTVMARESDVRVPEPLLAPGLLAGLGWMSILARRQGRARRRGEGPASHGLGAS